jgi:hypothetical protein
MNLSFGICGIPPIRQEKGEWMGHGVGTKSIGQRPVWFLRLCNQTCNSAVVPVAWGNTPAKEKIMNPDTLAISVPIVAIVSVFTFTTFAVWFGTRQKEREAFYKAETLRRITEASSDGAKAAMDLLREEERLKRIKAREGIKIGGVVNVGVGIGLVIFLWTLVGPKVALCGLIPGLIGAALLVYAYYLAAPVE